MVVKKPKEIQKEKIKSRRVEPAKPEIRLDRTYNIKKYFPTGRKLVLEKIETLDDAKAALEKLAKAQKATEENPVEMSADGLSFKFVEITGTKAKPVKTEVEYKIL